MPNDTVIIQATALHTFLYMTGTAWALGAYWLFANESQRLPCSH